MRKNPIKTLVTMWIMEHAPLWLSAKLAIRSNNMQLMLYAIRQCLVAGKKQPTGDLIKKAYEMLSREATTLEEYDDLIKLRGCYGHYQDAKWYC